MNRSFLVGLTVFLVGIFATDLAAFAQAGISQEQIRMFQSLPPAQQQQLMRQLGIDPSAFSGGAPTTDMSDDDSFAAPLPLMLPDELKDESGELRIQGDDAIVVTSMLKLDLDPLETREFMEDINRSRFLGTFLLQTDKRGVLDLKSIGAVPLAGLSAEEVAIRLSAEPLLAQLELEVTILPLTPIGKDALEPFGYRLFGALDTGSRGGDKEQSVPGAGRQRVAGMGAFGTMPSDSIPVPRGYVLGPGDELHVQLYGKDNSSMRMPVRRDGTINFPKLGPRPVAGLTFGELKNEIEQRVDEQLIGTEAAVTLGRLRSIRVFVVGDVKRPGAFTVSSLARITNALYYAGGITEIGSLRRVQLKRDGKLVTTLDLYDLLLKGDTSDDAQLRADDVIFVPPAQFQVGIDGEVKRPAIYEIRREKTLQDIVELAGGLLPTADATAVQLKRVSSSGTRDIETLNALQPSGAGTALQSGDFVMIYPAVAETAEAVHLSGHTARPGMYAWAPGMRLLDLIPSDRYLLPKADLGYLLIRREVGDDRRTSVLSADYNEALQNPESAANVTLQARDHVSVFQLGIARSAAIETILEELQAQATQQESFKMVQVSGQVRAPGDYPLEAGMRVSDLLRAGGGLAAAAFVEDAELRRYVIDAKGDRSTELLPVDLSAIVAGDPGADFLLEPYDFLNVKEVPEWEEELVVIVLGEVRFPGAYPMRRGETLNSVIERAGGLTDLAFVEGSVFTREVLRQRESEQLEMLASRLEADLTGLALQTVSDPSANSQQAVSVGQSLLDQLRSSQPTGRLVIDLQKIVASEKGSEFDIELRHGDQLMVPRRSQEVMVIGEVQYATSHLYGSSRNRDDYLGLSGGLTANADSKRIYVVRANGAVVAGKNSRWFRGSDGGMHAGDTIVVPMKTDRVPNIVQWASITQIIYNMAIAVAAVNSF